jgi:phosphate transport system protein
MVRALARTALELERVGDESKKIARFAQRASGSGAHDPVVAVAPYLRHMAELSVTMLRGAVRAFDEGDAQRAREVLARDRELDAEFATALRQLMSVVMQDQHFIQATIDTVFALKGLERIGDHAKNISEQVCTCSRRAQGDLTGTCGRFAATGRPGPPRQSTLRSSSLMPTLARVRASTRLTITAQ